MREDFGVTVQHVKLADTAEAVNRVRLEQQAKKITGGSIDLIWINGENFATMKSEGLLFGPWAEHLPAFAGVDVEGKPTTVLDFQTPTEGFEAPWGMAQFNVIVDGALAPDFPTAPERSDGLGRSKSGPLYLSASRPISLAPRSSSKRTLALSDNPNALYAPVDVAEFCCGDSTGLGVSGSAAPKPVAARAEFPRLRTSRTAVAQRRRNRSDFVVLPPRRTGTGGG